MRQESRKLGNINELLRRKGLTEDQINIYPIISRVFTIYAYRYKKEKINCVYLCKDETVNKQKDEYIKEIYDAVCSHCKSEEKMESLQGAGDGFVIEEIEKRLRKYGFIKQE